MWEFLLLTIDCIFLRSDALVGERPERFGKPTAKMTPRYRKFYVKFAMYAFG